MDYEEFNDALRSGHPETQVSAIERFFAEADKYDFPFGLSLCLRLGPMTAYDVGIAYRKAVASHADAFEVCTKACTKLLAIGKEKYQAQKEGRDVSDEQDVEVYFLARGSFKFPITSSGTLMEIIGMTQDENAYDYLIGIGPPKSRSQIRALCLLGDKRAIQRLKDVDTTEVNAIGKRIINEGIKYLEGRRYRLPS